MHHTDNEFMQLPHSLPVQSPSLSLDVHSRWVSRRGISRGSDVGVSLSVCYLTSPLPFSAQSVLLSPLPVFANESLFVHHLATCHVTSARRSHLTMRHDLSKVRPRDFSHLSLISPWLTLYLQVVWCYCQQLPFLG
jgi:hypothetical protein